MAILAYLYMHVSGDCDPVCLQGWLLVTETICT